MSNADLFQKVKDLNLPIGEYALFGSAPMGIRGLKECSDVDLLVTDGIWKKYDGQPGWEYKYLDDNRVALENKAISIEMATSWWPGEWDCQKIIQEAEIINGLPFVRLETVLKWKKIVAREKDLKDVETIEKFLHTRSN